MREQIWIEDDAFAIEKGGVLCPRVHRCIACSVIIASCIQTTDSRYPYHRHRGGNAFLRQRQSNDANACHEIG
jgi:hypothetical protein